jgi:hypothetical protein
MTKAIQTRPLYGFRSTCLTLVRGSERGVLQIDDETGLVAGCGAMPSVIGATKTNALTRLRERGWGTTKE